jgi:curved DNA-binding protein CbpA
MMIEWREEHEAEANRRIVWQDCPVVPLIPQVPLYYQRLELALDATAVEIKRAYRRLARQFHPDARAASERSLAEASMQQLNEAYAVLGDPQRRLLYDRMHQLRSA